VVDIFSHGRMPILAVSRLHLIDPSSIEHKCLLDSLLNAFDRQSLWFLSVCVCVCPPIGCRTITSAILYRFSPNFACRSDMWLFRTLLFLGQTGSRLPILEVCKSDLAYFGSFEIVVAIFVAPDRHKNTKWVETKLHWLCTPWSTKPEIQLGF